MPSIDLSSLVKLDVNDNKLTFEDFMAFTSLTDFANVFVGYDNQATQVIPRTDTVAENDFWDWILPFDSDLTSNTYYWYKDGLSFDTTTVGTLDISAVNGGHSGVYHCEVVNATPVLLGTRIITNTRTLYVELDDVIEPDCFTISDISVAVNASRCTHLALVDISVTTVGNVEGDLNYLINDIDTLTNVSFTLYDEGVYSLKLIDDVCAVEAGAEIVVSFVFLMIFAFLFIK